MKYILSIIVLLLLFTEINSAQLRLVPKDYQTIQDAINASSNGDTVLIQPGIYYENINFNGHNIVLASLYLTTGDSSYISSTIIDGDSSGSVVTFESGEDSTTKIIGFTITNGGFIYCRGSGINIVSSHPVIERNIIKNNKVGMGFGGGIFCDSSNAIVKENTILNNHALDGGGICCFGGNPLIEKNIITYNSCKGFGGGIWSKDSNPLIKENIIIGNSTFNNASQFGGGGIACTQSNAEIINNIIAHNKAGGICLGGGINVCQNSNSLIINNTIYGNTTDENLGNGIYSSSSSFSVITNCIIWGNAENEILISNTSSATYCAVQGNYSGVGNIGNNPLFSGDLITDFNVCTQSPCINTGDPNIIDPDGTRSDIGFFYWDHEVCNFGNTWYVSILGNDTTGNGSQQNPFRTIQHAIDESFFEDMIVVENGMYNENINLHGKNPVLTSMYIFSGDTLDIKNTVIHSDTSGLSTAIISMIGCDTPATIYGFTVNSMPENRLIGIYINGSECLISNNIIDGNLNGITSFYADGIIKNNTIKNNINSWWGGGLLGRNSNLEILNNSFINNDSEEGGGINLYEFGFNKIIKNMFFGNKAIGFMGFGGAGGGVSVEHSTYALIMNNVFYSNTADYCGGGLYAHSVVIKNNLFFRNSSNYAGAINCVWSELVNNIMWEDSASTELYGWPTVVEYCNIQDTIWPGAGNISVNPLLRDPDNGDFHLMATVCGDPFDSPCIDMGSPNIIDSLLNCSWGLGTERSDMGVYGGGDSILVGVKNQEVEIPKEYSLYQNYPNPFNPTTTIKYSLPVPSRVTLKIYNTLGEEVQTLINQEQAAGHYEVVFNAINLASGVYFYRMRADNFTETRKLIFLK